MGTNKKPETLHIPALMTASVQDSAAHIEKHMGRVQHGRRLRLLALKRPSLSYGELLGELGGVAARAREAVIGLSVSRRMVEEHQLALFRRLDTSLKAAREALEGQWDKRHAIAHKSLSGTDEALVAHLPSLTDLIVRQTQRLGLAALAVLGQIELCTRLVEGAREALDTLRRACLTLEERLEGRLEAFEMETSLGGGSALDASHLTEHADHIAAALAQVQALDVLRAERSLDAVPLFGAMLDPQVSLPAPTETTRAAIDLLTLKPISRASLFDWLAQVEGKAENLGSLTKQMGQETGAAPQEGVDRVTALIAARAADAMLRQAVLTTDSDALDRARDTMVVAIDALRSALGTDHPNTLRAIGILANAYALRGNTDEALKLHRDTWHKQRVLLGEDHPDAWDSAESIASVCRQRGDLSEAIGLQARVVKWRSAFLGTGDPSALSSLGRLARMRWEDGQTESAVALATKLAAQSETHLGDNHPDTLDRMEQVGLWESDPKEATQWRRRALNRRLKQTGDTDVAAQDAMESYARALKSHGDLHGARTWFERLAEARRNVLGPRHAKTTMALWLLRVALRGTHDATAINTIDARLAWILDLKDEGLTDLQKTIRRHLGEDKATR